MRSKPRSGIRILENGELRARPLGIHLEGPFISHKRRGVHPPENLLAPSLAAFDRFWQAARGHIRVLTIAPELPGALEVIAEAAARGVCVSLGHSDADLNAARAGFAAGARHATHTFNAMRPLDHRDPGILGEVLTDPRLSADIIADGIHVDPVIVQLIPEGQRTGSRRADHRRHCRHRHARRPLSPGLARSGSERWQVHGWRKLWRAAS